MRFEWDDRKNELNHRKHDVTFEIASTAFDDPFALTQPDISSEDEERWITLGAVEPGLVLFVVHTHIESEGEEVIRIISARKAESSERKLYEEAHKDAKRRHKKASRKTRRRH
jgi:uncharacterized DUF497 family protein